MKKPLIFCLGVLLTVTIASPTLAAGQKKNLPDPSTLATIIPDECTLFPESPETNALYVSWGWEDGTVQTKFGGDAVYYFTGSVSVPNEDINIPDAVYFYEDEEVKIEIARYPGAEELAANPDDYAGKLLYWCEPSEDAAEGYCIGVLKDEELSVFNALMDKWEYPLGSEVLEGAIYSLQMVNVKAMNPGKNGRQNYSLSNEVNICEGTPL